MGAQAKSVEISWTASEAIASWRRILAQTIGDKRQNLERASIELLRLAGAEPDSKPAIVDELAEMAIAAGIDDDEAQAIFARAAKAPPDTINGCAVSQAPGGKNALAAFPLQAFENVRLQTDRCNYWSKDCSQIPGSPSFGVRRNAANPFGPQTSVCTLRLAGITAATGCSRRFMLHWRGATVSRPVSRHFAGITT